MTDFSPAYYERGKIVTLGDGLIRCHVCGNTFKTLGRHTLYAHGLTAKEYRREFNITGGLVAPEYKNRLARTNGTRLTPNYRKEIHRHCVQCGKEFQLPLEQDSSTRWKRTKIQKLTCSVECRVARQRKLFDEMIKRTDVRKKMSEAGKRRAQSATRTSNGRWQNRG